MGAEEARGSDGETRETSIARNDAALLAVLGGGLAGWVAAANAGVSGLSGIGVIIGAAILLGGLLAVPALLS